MFKCTGMSSWCTTDDEVAASSSGTPDGKTDKSGKASRNHSYSSQASQIEFEGDQFFSAPEPPETYEIKKTNFGHVDPAGSPASIVAAHIENMKMGGSEANSTAATPGDSRSASPTGNCSVVDDEDSRESFLYIYPPGDDNPEGQELDEEELRVLNEMKSISKVVAGKITGYEIVTRALRGYKTYPDRIKDTADALENIMKWRIANAMDTIIQRKLPFHDIYHENWPSYICGEDDECHVIQYEKASDIKGSVFEAMIKDGTCTLDDIVLLRSQLYEYVDHIKRTTSEKNGKRRYKHVVIMDMDGFAFSAFSGGIREIMKPVLAVGSDNYPEAMHKTFIINAPWTFRTIWAVVKSWIHPLTREKIKVLGGKSAYLPEMQKNGIDLNALPTFLGGTNDSRLIGEMLTGELQRQSEMAVL